MVNFIYFVTYMVNFVTYMVNIDVFGIILALLF